MNSFDDNGILVGKWDSDYIDGVSPIKWNGSVRILRQHADSKKAVKYGQCFVFSGVVTTSKNYYIYLLEHIGSFDYCKHHWTHTIISCEVVIILLCLFSAAILENVFRVWSYFSEALKKAMM